MKKIGAVICTFMLVMISMSLLNFSSDKLNAASNYSTGNKVYIGNDSYTVIDPNTMTLLKDTATDAGDVTWNDAVASLNNLASNYGELGSKAVANNFSLPTSTDLAVVTNVDNTALVNIDPIANDWWLGDASVDNRSKFVGANTNSLVTDFSIIKNVADTVNLTCNMGLTVLEQGIKPTITKKQEDTSFKVKKSQAYVGANTMVVSAKFYSDTQCESETNSIKAIGEPLFIQVDGFSNSSLQIPSTNIKNFFHYYAFSELGGDEHANKCLGNGSDVSKQVGESDVCPVDNTLVVGEKFYLPAPNTCVVAKDNPFDVKSFMITKPQTDVYVRMIMARPNQAATNVTCPGAVETAGTSSVRPLLTLNKNKIAYSSVMKPAFNTNPAINQPVPEVEGNYSYLTLKDSDLGIGLDSSNPNVSGNKLTIDRSNTTVSIPVSLSSTTSGTRYVSVVAMTNSGERYSVLGQVNGNTGTVQLDLTSLANYQTAKTLNLTLYQEVDEGTKTTYRGNGTQITLEMKAAPITDITFTPNYPSGKTSWTEGDAGIDTAGAKTGTFTFTGGTSGINDPISGKDYKKWEIVDASGNPTTDANFDIVNNELKAKKRISAGTYTLKVKVTDNENETFTDTITITVVGHPTPTLLFTPVNTNLTYGDNQTKVNNVIGNYSLQYPAGKPTSNIATIQLGTGGDEAHFSIDTTGALKVKGNDLDAGTYSISVSGTDGNGVSFSKSVSITVAKKDQNNYQITNHANYPLQINQEINITTTGNDSGENEAYTVTSGSNVAQISNTVKFKLLNSGTFTLQATVGGNKNYNPKTVTKQITVSQLPVQNPAISITSNTSMTYGDTYHPSYSGGQGSGAVSWSIESDNGTGAVLNNGIIKVTGVGSFTLTVTKAGDGNVQASSDSQVITVNKRKITVKPKNVTKVVGQVFKDNGATYTPQPIAGDNLGTLVITSKYPSNQAPGQYTDGIQASGLSNPNYDFVYQDGTLIINSNNLPNNGLGYYTISGTKGRNNWYISDIEIATTGKDGYDEISKDGINFQTNPLVYSTDGDYPINFYLRNSSTGIIAKAISYQIRIDQTAPDVPTVTMKQKNKNVFARFVNALSFGNWMNQAVQVTMTSNDVTSGLDYYEYTETSQSATNKKTSASGTVTYQNDVELTIQAKACDKAGNCSALSNSEDVMIDTKAPVITGVKDKSVYKHYYLPRFVNVKDNGSGLSYSEYKLDGAMAGTIQEDIDERIDIVGEYEVYAIDNAGNDITLTFKLVPLPDIQTEIDGSDQSKDIIDQVIDEYNDVKNKLDADEKKDYEQWIKDALDRWNSLRKKVVETDDKSAKVEGQGDTSFDPSVVLIVDDIGENDVPPLPRKAIAIYDVYLQKGNVRIQPDGKIKVYLPYAGAPTNVGYAMGGVVAQPIVYQIDEKDKISELKCNLEGSFVTFITDELLRYAISDENQKCPLDGIDINIDSDGDGKPDVNIDINGDCKADLNVDTDGDGQPNINIDTDLDGKPDYNVDTDGDGKPDVNIGAVNEPFESTVCKTVKGLEYCSDPYKKPYLNIDSDGDGRPDINVDLDGDMEADINIDIDGDNIPDLNIDSDGDGLPDINIDTDNDGKADKNILKLKEWKPDKNVDGSIKYDTMSGLLSLLNDKDDDISKPSKPMGGALTGSDTSDSSTPFLWWILVLINIITMFWCYMRVKKEKKQSYER